MSRYFTAAAAAAATTSATRSQNTDSRSSTFLTKASLAAALVASVVGVAASSSLPKTDLDSSLETSSDDDTTTTILNWSGTHSVVLDNRAYWEPESIAEVEQVVQYCHKHGQPVRPVGSALSPNAIAFRRGGMMSMANLDDVVTVDTLSTPPTVTVQAGARISHVVEALRPYNLTLPNLASIAEQQMGGFVQVGAHGTGATIAPVDHYVTKLKLVTPAKGTLELSANAETEEERELFHLAKVGLGCLGVLVEVTMECIPAHRLVEHTFVLTRQQAKDQLDVLLKKHKHMRYMWIPFEDAVVCVTNDPEDKVAANIPRGKTHNTNDEERFQPLTDLLLELSKEYEEMPMTTATLYTKESIKGMGFGDLRDALLAFDPLNVEHVKRVNKAEAEFWRRSEGYQTKPSDQLLQFDCGGQVRQKNTIVMCHLR